MTARCGISSRTEPVRRVVVIGNGPVGQTASLLLARWGVPVLTLDARPGRDPAGSKSICQQRDVLDVWDAVGAGRPIADEGVTWTTARTFYRDRELFSFTFPDQGEQRFPPFVNLSQARTEALLDERIAAEPLIEVRWGHTVSGLSQHMSGVRLACVAEDGTVEIDASYVVACTGARGEIRDLLGIPFEGKSFADRFLICDIRAELPGWANERRFYFDPAWNPGRQVLIHPCPDSTFRIDWQVPADYDLDGEEASGALDARIRAIVGDRPYEIVWKSVYRFHSRVAGRLRAGRVLLAGDVAHLYAPFGARGLNSGVADAENAAWKVAFAWHGWADDALLESYHDERHAAALENLAVTTSTMDFLVPRDEERRAYRRTMLDRAVTDASARTKIDSGRLSEPFWYTASPLTTPDPGRPFGGRPARGGGAAPRPGPGVLVPDALVALPDRVHFRELARTGFLLSTTGDAEAARRAAEAVQAPCRVLDLTEIDPEGTLTAALDAKPGEVWIIRPDAHVAAVLLRPGVAELTSALARALATHV